MSRLAFLVLMGFFAVTMLSIARAGDLPLPAEANAPGGGILLSLGTVGGAGGPALCTGSVAAAPASCNAPARVILAQSGAEACGCQAGQSCCATVCCPGTHPHYCPGDKCYQTISDAQAICGNSFEVCGVPQ